MSRSGKDDTEIHPLYLSDPASIMGADLTAEVAGLLPDLSLYNGVRVWDRDVEGAEAADRLLRMFDPAHVRWRWLGTSNELIAYIRELRNAHKYPLGDRLRGALADCLALAEKEAVRRLTVLRTRQRRGDRFQSWQDADLVAEVEAVAGPGVVRGRSVIFRCPFHDDRHPSLSVNPEKHVWYCHPCGCGGGVVDWRKAIEVAA